VKPAGPADAVAWRAIRAGARLLVRRRVDLAVEGLAHVPRSGPVLVASRHFHHLYDACVLLAAVPRPLHFLVALDWVRGRRGRRLMEGVCGVARWPVVLRADELARRHAAGRASAPLPPRAPRVPHAQGGGSRPAALAYGSDEAPRYLRRGTRDAAALLRAGRALVVFPEGYPNVDPDVTPKGEDGAFLPFRPGFARLAAIAQRDGRSRVPIVPAGLEYAAAGGEPAPGLRTWEGTHWRVALRFGAPLTLDTAGSAERVAAAVERRVRELCGAT
jgi:putative membrane protein